MLETELFQAELAVIEAGIALAKLRLRVVEPKIAEVKTSFNSHEADHRMASLILAIESELQAIKENLSMIEARVEFFHSVDNQASPKTAEQTSSLRAHVELNNDRLCLMVRELNHINQDICHPRFVVAHPE